MNQPDLYHKANRMQRHDAAAIIKRFRDTTRWRYDGRDALIDVGSGTGDVLVDFLYPTMPDNFRRIVCSDINSKIVAYAQSCYGHIEKTEFRTLNIETHEELPEDLKGQFDHVTSFYALMWVKNQRQCLSNIYKLLRPEGGDCLLTFLTYHVMFDGYKCVSQQERWSKYMPDVDTVFSAIINSSDPGREYREFMEAAGFKNITIEVEHKEYTYESVEEFKANMKAVNPWLSRIPLSLHDGYMDDLIAIVVDILAMKSDVAEAKAGFVVPYETLIAYGQK